MKFSQLFRRRKRVAAGDSQAHDYLYSEKVGEALSTIAQWDRAHERKGVRSVPYLLHPLTVSAYVWDEGGSEDEAIAALFHDSIEDWNELTVDQATIRPTLELFGPRVVKIVEACTDGEPEHGAPKPPWFKRKIDHIARIQNSDDLGILRVVAADKLSNLRSMLNDLRGESSPTRNELWSHFKGGVFGTEWYYQSMVNAVGGLGKSSRLLGGLNEELAKLGDLIDPLRSQLSDQAIEIQQSLSKRVRQQFPSELNDEINALAFSFEFARRKNLPDSEGAVKKLGHEWMGDPELPERVIEDMNAEGDYWVYENWFKGGARVHHASCRYCQNGNGQYPTEVKNPKGEWFGPYLTRQQAMERALYTRRTSTECKVCDGIGD